MALVWDLDYLSRMISRCFTYHIPPRAATCLVRGWLRASAAKLGFDSAGVPEEVNAKPLAGTLAASIEVKGLSNAPGSGTAFVFVCATNCSSTADFGALMIASPSPVQTALVLISISDMRVRWTGHLFAISSSLDRCSVVSLPAK